MADEPDETPVAPPSTPDAPERADAGAPQPDFDEQHAVEQLLQAREQPAGNAGEDTDAGAAAAATGAAPETAAQATAGDAAVATDLNAQTADIPLPDAVSVAAAASASASASTLDAGDAADALVPESEPIPEPAAASKPTPAGSPAPAAAAPTSARTPSPDRTSSPQRPTAEPRDHVPEHARSGKPTPPVRITRITPLDTQSSPLVIDRGVAVAGLKLRVGRRIIVEDASFTAAAGQVTALVGRAGSGKTSIMLALATLLRPTAGELRLCGVDLVRSPTDARGMFGWAPQRPPAWTGYTVRRSLTATARLWGYSKADSVDRADVLIELLGLTDLAKTRVAVLSPAHQQLVSLAASLLNDPQVVLVDEPTGSLDHPITEHIISVLRALAAEGKAVLVTSQTDDAITDWTDRQHYLVAGHTADAAAIARSMRSPQSWSIHTTEIVSLVEALRAMRLPYTADETRSEVHIVLENAQAASLLLSKLADVPITQYAPALSPAEHIISTLEEANRA